MDQPGIKLSSSNQEETTQDNEESKNDIDINSSTAEEQQDKELKATSSSLQENTITKEGSGQSKDGSKNASPKRIDILSIDRGKFICVHFLGTIEKGCFEKVNDVYIRYSIVCGPEWVLSSGIDVGITQIARFRASQNGAHVYTWNQPISVSYRSYNYYGWPQIVLSVYHYDLFGNDQILGYGCAHLPISNQNRSAHRIPVQIYSPQSSSFGKQLISWITGRKPELVDANLFARGDCRSVLQMVTYGQVELNFSVTTKDVSRFGYKS